MQDLGKLIKECMEDIGEDVRFSNTYSGRGMYGRECVGIIGSEDDCMEVVREVIKEAHASADPDFDEVVDSIMAFSRDSMGRSDIILYWPEIKPIEEPEEEYDGQPDEAQEWHDFDPDC